MAIEIKNLSGIKTSKGGIEIPKPLIRLLPQPMWETYNIRFDLKYCSLDSYKEYNDVGGVVYEKPIQIPVLETLTEEQIEQGVEPQIVSYKDGIEKVILPKSLTYSFPTWKDINSFYSQFDIKPENAQLPFSFKLMKAYHEMLKELFLQKDKDDKSIYFENSDDLFYRLDLA